MVAPRTKKRDREMSRGAGGYMVAPRKKRGNCEVLRVRYLCMVAP